MPVRKFTDLEDARRDLWVPAGAPDLAARLRALWAFSRRLAPPACPCGLKKFTSIEEANADSDTWTLRRARDLRACLKTLNLLQKRRRRSSSARVFVK